MSHGNKFDVPSHVQQRQRSQMPLDEMSNVLLDAMQGTLICLDHQHMIVDVSPTIKRYFGFEQNELIGVSILLLVEDSERDFFLKFLNNSQTVCDVCSIRIMVNHINEYRQVKVHRKKKFNQENVDVHSTTPRHSCSVGTTLVLTLENISFIDITLHDISKQEFYTKISLFGEIIFKDHRGALITGFLPHEMCSKSIFNFVYHEDRLVKLHALWKCVTTGASKLQWRLNARDGSLVFLQTEYKLILDSKKNQEIIFARNEVLSPTQRAQFDELQTAWRHQCTADIKGHSSSFKLINASDSDGSSSVDADKCRISVPALNLCFETTILQPLALVGNIFEGTKLVRPLTIQDYIQVLFDNQKYIDQELATIIQSIQSITARYRRSNESESMQTDHSMDEKNSTDLASRRKQDSDSIVRGILSSSMQYNQQNSTVDLEETSPTVTRLVNGNSNPSIPQNVTPRPSPSFSQPLPEIPNNSSKPITLENQHQQHVDFIKKYLAAKTKLESQLETLRSQELANGPQSNDATKRASLLNKLNQLETIKHRHLARRQEYRRQSTTTTPTPAPVQNSEQKDFLHGLLSSSNNSRTYSSVESNGPSPSIPSPLSSFFPSSNDQPSPGFFPSQSQRNPSQLFDTSHTSNYFDGQSQMKTSLFDEFLTPPPSSSSNTSSLVSVHSYMNVSYHGSNNDSSSFHHQQQQHPPHSSTYPY